MLNVRLAGDHLYDKWLFTLLSLVMFLMASFCADLKQSNDVPLRKLIPRMYGLVNFRNTPKMYKTSHITVRKYMDFLSHV